MTLFTVKDESLFHLSRLASLHLALKIILFSSTVRLIHYTTRKNNQISLDWCHSKKQKADSVLPGLLQTPLISLLVHLLVFGSLKNKPKQMVRFIYHVNSRQQQDETAIIQRYLSVLLHTLTSFYKRRQDNQFDQLTKEIFVQAIRKSMSSQQYCK